MKREERGVRVYRKQENERECLFVETCKHIQYIYTLKFQAKW